MLSLCVSYAADRLSANAGEAILALSRQYFRQCKSIIWASSHANLMIIRSLLAGAIDIQIVIIICQKFFTTFERLTLCRI